MIRAMTLAPEARTLLDKIVAAGAPPYEVVGAEATDLDPDTPSMLSKREGYLLTRTTMAWFRDQYCAHADRQNPDVAPLLADTVARVVPAIRTHPDQFHGFVTFTRFLQESHLAVADVGNAIRRTIGAP